MSKSKIGASKRWAKKHSARKSAIHKACQQATKGVLRRAKKSAARQGTAKVTSLAIPVGSPFAEPLALTDEQINAASARPTDGSDLPMYQFELKNKNTGKKFFVGPAATEDDAKELAVTKGFAKSVAPLSFCSAEVW